MASKSVEILVPELGESIVDATVGQWLKHDGETVTEGESVVELETEKVNMEVPAPASGVLKITRQEGETVAIGEPLGQIGEGETGATTSGQAPAAATTATSNGASTSNGAGGVQAASATPTATSAAPVSSPTASATSAAIAMPAANGHSASVSVHATPLARRVAEEHGVDLTTVPGTGPAGRITQEDVTNYLEQGASAAPTMSTPAANIIAPPPPRPTAPVAPPPPPPAARPAPAQGQATGRGEERIRMTRRRQTIAQRLKETQNTAAMLTTFNEVDMSAVMDLRKRRRDAFKERYGVSLGFMSFFTRAVIGGLKAFPRLNAEIQGNEIVLKRYYDIGIAVSTDEGLVVPVVRDADRLTFAQIEKTIADLARKAREGKLTLEDLQGGTFTITNGGTFGSLLSTPILNGTQVGILGMHKIEERPIAVNGQVVIHPMMYLAVSYDHRIVDGAEAVGFLVRVKELLEDPETLLLEG